jgi:hypothetical protein
VAQRWHCRPRAIGADQAQGEAAATGEVGLIVRLRDMPEPERRDTVAEALAGIVRMTT